MSETFETHLAALEEAVRQLESGEEPLERSLAIYEEAVARLKACHVLLAKAEGRITILDVDEEGGVTERDFRSPAEE